MGRQGPAKATLQACLASVITGDEAEELARFEELWPLEQESYGKRAKPKPPLWREYLQSLFDFQMAVAGLEEVIGAPIDQQ